MREPGHVTDAPGFRGPLAERRRQDESRRNPRKTRDTDFGKSHPQQKPCNDGEQKTASQECFGRKFFQPRQLASKVPKRKFSETAVAAVCDRRTISFFPKTSSALTFAKLCARFH